MKEDKAERVAEEGENGRWQAQFRAVDEGACTTDRVARLWIARTGGILAETAQRGCSARIEPFRQRD